MRLSWVSPHDGRERSRPVELFDYDGTRARLRFTESLPYPARWCAEKIGVVPAVLTDEHGRARHVRITGGAGARVHVKFLPIEPGGS
jgi:hypothetical protein